MDWFFDFISNKFFITAVVSWTVAQVLKVFIHAFITKSWDFSRLFGDGGMPSGHSATVSSLATISALTYGFGSFEFAISGILAIIVCQRFFIPSCSSWQGSSFKLYNSCKRS